MEARLRAWVERRLGRIGALEDRSWPHGVTRVWRIEGTGQIAWVKQHTHERKFRQEDRAYDEVVPSLAAAGIRVPTRLARDSGLRALILSDVPGVAPQLDDLAAFRSAGQALRLMHELPCAPADPVPLAEALRARLERWTAEGRGAVDDALLAEVAGRFGNGAAFDGLSRCWCHRDWSARNWLLAEGSFGLVDFEHTAPDLGLVDVARLIETAPDAAVRAFFGGYGALPPEAADLLDRVCWLTALGTLVWAAVHQDPEFEALGRRLLGRLRQR